MGSGRLAVLIGLLLALSSATHAQLAATESAHASGAVRTAGGITVPGATVRLVNTQTGQAWVSWTDENGKFEFPGIPAGHYRIEVEQLGFTPASREFDLSACGTEPIEVALPVAALEEEKAPPAPAKTPAEAAGANPSANPPANQPGNGNAQPGGRGRQAPPGIVNAIQQGIGPGGFQQVDLTGNVGSQSDESAGPANSGPLGAASSSDAFLLSGTVGQGAGGNTAGLATFGIPGGLGNPGGFPGQAGGIPGQSGRDGGMNPVYVPAPAGSAASQQGRQGEGSRQQRGQGRGQQRGAFGEGVGGLWGAQRIQQQQVNRVRFSFYDRYENSAWDARPYSLTEPNPPKISHYDDRFGANLGGPLRIPRVYDGRDKTFFFVNYQHDRQQSPVDSFATVPTDPERKGNFCDLAGVQLFDPKSNLAGPRAPLGCSISKDPLDQAALGLLNFIPKPNLPGSVQNFHLQTTVPVASDFVNVHVLHTINAKLNFQAGYNFNSVRQQSLVNFPGIGSHMSVRNQNVTLGLTQNLSPRLIHDSRINWNRSRTQLLSNFSFTQDIEKNLGITGVSQDPINFGLPLISLTNFTDINDPVPALTRNQTLRYIDSVIYTRTKHTWRAGFELHRMQINTVSDPTPRGQFTFTGLMTSQLDSQGNPIPNTGFDFADFLLGLPQATATRFGSSSTYFRSWGYVGYAQDDWRLNPRFTLEYGVRYEAVTPPIELFNHIANLDLNSDISKVSTVVPGGIAPFNGPLPRSLIRGDYNNWAPRLGIAWAPKLKLKTIVRAGYSIFCNESIYNQLSAEMANQPPWAQAQTLLTTANQVLTLEDGFPNQPQTTVKNTAAVDPNYRVGYAQIWNLTVETQFTQNWSADIAYTGTKGTHLDLLRAPNRAAPGSPLTTDEERRIADASGFTYDTFGASSIYHALQLRVQKRYSRGLSLMGVYTYGKSIDNSSSIGGGTPVVVQDDTNFRAERGLSSFDVRHQFRLFSVYELPFGEKKRWARKGLSAHLLGNLRANGVAIAATGTPFTARVLGNAADNTGTGANFSMRADQVGNPSLLDGARTPLHFFNTDAFTVPLPGFFGDAARNTIPGPGTFNINFGLARTFRFGKDNQRSMVARWEVQNLTNTPNFQGLSTVVNSATFGRVLGAKAMRAMDLTIRVSF